MAPKIIVVGSANTDFVVRVPQLPARGETVQGDVFRVVRGGKGANQAVAAARLGGQVTFVARLGEDGFGDDAVAAYDKEGICTDYVFREKNTPSGVALIMVNRKGENVIAIAPGANAHLKAEDVAAAESAIAAADCLLVQLEIPFEAVQAAVDLGHKHHVQVILNPAPAKQLPKALLQKVDYLTPNEGEAELLAGDSLASDKDFLDMLPSLIPTRALIVTLGAKGACLLSNGGKTFVPPFKVTPVDTTAAGDAFNGALAVALASGKSIHQSILYANAAGALAATHPGAQPSLPTARELDFFIYSAAWPSSPTR
jgi:ribokinase